MAAPHVSVVIACLNEARHLPALLDRLAEQSAGAEVIVVDGGSTDGTPAVAARWQAAHPDVCLRWLDNPARHIPHALNRGIAAAAGEVIVRLDGHALPAPDYVRQCCAVLAETGAVVVGGAWKVRPGAESRMARAIALAVSAPLGAGDARYRLARAAAGEVETVPFGCFLRQTWARLGGYNETLLSNEDYEFNARVRQQGGRVYFDPRIQCDYYARPTLGGLAAQYWRYGWWKAQMLKRHPRSLRVRQAVPLAWSLAGLIVLGLAVFTGPVTARLALAAWAGYLGLLAVAAARLAARAGDGRLWLALVAAFAVIHFAWGWGAWAGFLSRTSGDPLKR